MRDHLAATPELGAAVSGLPGVPNRYKNIYDRFVFPKNKTLQFFTKLF